MLKIQLINLANKLIGLLRHNTHFDKSKLLQHQLHKALKQKLRTKNGKFHFKIMQL